MLPMPPLAPAIASFAAEVVTPATIPSFMHQHHHAAAAAAAAVAAFTGLPTAALNFPTAVAAASSHHIPQPAPQPHRPKHRKEYTHHNQRQTWSDDEHLLFTHALTQYGRAWSLIAEHLNGSKTIEQIRSHAQKYFARLEKEGRAAEIPPARLKKKASAPYPVAKETKRRPVMAHQVQTVVTADATATAVVSNATPTPSVSTTSSSSSSSSYSWNASQENLRRRLSVLAQTTPDISSTASITTPITATATPTALAAQPTTALAAIPCSHLFPVEPLVVGATNVAQLTITTPKVDEEADKENMKPMWNVQQTSTSITKNTQVQTAVTKTKSKSTTGKKTTGSGSSKKKKMKQQRKATSTVSLLAPIDPVASALPPLSSALILPSTPPAQRLLAATLSSSSSLSSSFPLQSPFLSPSALMHHHHHHHPTSPFDSAFSSSSYGSSEFASSSMSSPQVTSASSPSHSSSLLTHHHGSSPSDAKSTVILQTSTPPSYIRYHVDRHHHHHNTHTHESELPGKLNFDDVAHDSLHLLIAHSPTRHVLPSSDIEQDLYHMQDVANQQQHLTVPSSASRHSHQQQQTPSSASTFRTSSVFSATKSNQRKRRTDSMSSISEIERASVGGGGSAVERDTKRTKLKMTTIPADEIPRPSSDNDLLGSPAPAFTLTPFKQPHHHSQHHSLQAPQSSSRQLRSSTKNMHAVGMLQSPSNAISNAYFALGSPMSGGGGHHYSPMRITAPLFASPGR